MATKKLTTKQIENAKPGSARREISDGGSGLYLVLQSSGHRSWALRFRSNRKPAKLTLGAWPALTLAAARKAAADALHDLSQGNDPAEGRRTAKQKAAERVPDTLANVCQNYLKREGHKLRTLDQRVSILRRLVYPALGERQVESIKRSEIVRLLDQIEDKNGPRMADVTLAALRTIFNWHALRSDEFRSPIVKGMARQNAAEHRRSRILDDDELRAIWKATTVENDPFAALVRFLLLTSARRTEAAAMKFGEADSEGIWTLPASRSKTKTEVIRPLSKAARVLLAERPRIVDCPYVFTNGGVSALTSLSTLKRTLDKASGVTGWRLHDLRRTARSLLSRAGVNADVAERCLGHAIPGVRGVYDRHSFLPEMAHAFEALAALIERIVDPQQNVVPLRGA